jgi:hypothetical protein
LEFRTVIGVIADEQIVPHDFHIPAFPYESLISSSSQQTGMKYSRGLLDVFVGGFVSHEINNKRDYKKGKLT